MSSGEADPAVLGRLLTAYNLLPALPLPRLAEFVSQALSSVPGVIACAVRLPDQEEASDPPVPDGDLTFAVRTADAVYGSLRCRVRDRARLSPYEPFIANLASFLALLLENRRQKEDLEAANQRLRERESEYALLFGEMLDGFALHEIILNESGVPSDYRFLQVNHAFEVLTGLRGEDILGRTLLEILPGSEPSWVERYGRIAVSGGEEHFEDYARELDRYYEVHAYRPRPGQFATIVNDVTERKRAEEVLAREAAALEHAYQREHETAEYLQRAMLPEVPHIEGLQVDVTYESATDATLVGGDFYDVLSLKSGRAAILVGDVCGKGLPAASEMARVRSTIRAYAALAVDPAQWLSLVDTGLGEDARPEFTTVALVDLDLATGELRCALAGHPAPLLVRAGEVISVEAPAGLPLGMGPSPVPREFGVASMGPEDTLVLFTDGVSEARRGGRLFGAEELEADVTAISCQRFAGCAERLVVRAREFAGGRLADDAVVVAVRLDCGLAAQ